MGELMNPVLRGGGFRHQAFLPLALAFGLSLGSLWPLLFGIFHRQYCALALNSHFSGAAKRDSKPLTAALVKRVGGY